MKFSEVLKSIQDGHMAYRNCWDDNVAIWLKPSCVIKADWCKDPILKMLCESNNGALYAEAVMCMVNDGAIVTGWNPTAEDMLADDWEIIYNEESYESK